MVSAPSCELKTCTPATRSAWAFGHFSAQTARRDSSAGCRGSAYGVTGMLENSLPMPPNCRRVANRKPSRSNALVALVRPSSSRHVSSWRLGCRAARRAPFAANRTSTPRTPWRSPPARAGKDQSAGRAPTACSKLQGDGGRAKTAQRGEKGAFIEVRHRQPQMSHRPRGVDRMLPSGFTKSFHDCSLL